MTRHYYTKQEAKFIGRLTIVSFLVTVVLLLPLAWYLA